MNNALQKLAIVCFYSVLFAALTLAACGDPTDNPEDCTANEFFDDGSELCRTCPALTQPECPAGCGFFIAPEDDRPCPQAVCLIPQADSCVCPVSHPDCSTEVCGEGEVFDASEFQCVDCDISCESDFEIENGTCVCSS